jgi:hypothetical protein
VPFAVVERSRSPPDSIADAVAAAVDAAVDAG